MMERKNTYLNEESLNRIVENAIESEIGQIDPLPPHVVARLKEVYGAFLSGYVEIIRLKENHPKEWQPEKIAIDPDVVEEMLHFFSDYQHLTRDFREINKKVKNLLKLNREDDPRHFDACVEEIVSGARRSPDMSSVLDE